MSDYNFSAAERYAVFTVHRERCWLCDEMVSLSDMQIDHIIPEELLGKPELEEALRSVGLPENFDLNSYGNWMPAHGRCNRRKGKHVFRLTPIIQLSLENAQNKSARASELQTRYVNNRKVDRALNDVFIAHENGTLTEDQRKRLIGLFGEFHVPNREPEVRDEPVFIAPWLQVLNDDGRMLTIRGANGMIGIRPAGSKLHPSWDCPRCGPTGWNGARCITCGILDDGD